MDGCIDEFEKLSTMDFLRPQKRKTGNKQYVTFRTLASLSCFNVKMVNLDVNIGATKCRRRLMSPAVRTQWLTLLQ